MKAKNYSITLLVFVFVTMAVCPLWAQFNGGLGTQESPYLVANAGQLNQVRLYPTAYFAQSADLDLDLAPYNSGLGWQAIGTIDTPFSGHFDGNGYQISGLYLNRPQEDYLGLFGYISNALLQGISLSGGQITGRNYVGGLAGSAQESIISECSVQAEITGAEIAGGLIGSLALSSQLSYSAALVQVSGTFATGALCGYAKGNSEIFSCVSRGSVTGEIAAGGLIGILGGSDLQRCYSTAAVSANSSSGGLIGENDTQSTVWECYSIGSVSADTNAGGLIGRNLDSSATNSYWDTQSSGISYSALGEGRLTQDMSYPFAANTYQDWDFEASWSWDEDYNGGYPYHVWEYSAPILIDLAVEAFSGPSVLGSDFPALYTLQIANLGNQVVDSFEAKLFSQAEELLDSQSFGPIQPGETLSVSLSWTPTAAYQGFVYATLELAGDINPENNQSQEIAVTVYEGVFSASIGSGDLNARIPLDFFWKTSVFETIYYADELGFNGMIFNLEFYNNFSSELLNKPTRIWLAETTQTELIEAWIPSDEMQLVFDGTVDFPMGENAISITLDTPFSYQSGNLVMLVQRPLDTNYYSSQDYFQAQSSPSQRSRSYHSDVEVLDVTNPDAPGSWLGDYPRCTFRFMGQAYQAPPTELSLEYFPEDGFLSLSWQPPEVGNPLSYNVYRNQEFYAEAFEPYFEDSELSPGETYSYYVSAVYATGESEPSNVVSQEISFPLAYIPDDNFRRAINFALGEAAAYQPNIAELESLDTIIEAEEMGIVSLEGAQHLINLPTLYLGENQISDLGPLSNLTLLQNLDLNYNQISDISPLSNLTNLQILYMTDNQISDLSALSNLTLLQALYLNDNQITDLGPLSNMSLLVRLYLFNNQISDLSPVNSLSNLQRLYVGANQITELSPITALSNLQALVLSSNQISDLGPLADLNNLEWLILNDNQINELSFLSSLSNLQELDLGTNRISDISPLSALANLTELNLDANPLSYEAMLLTQSWELPYSTDIYNALSPCYPEPERDAMDVFLNAGLLWQGNYDSQPAQYEVYMGDSPQSLSYLGEGYPAQEIGYAFDAALQPLTQYYWRVKAVSDTVGIWSGLWSFTTGETALLAEIGVDPTPIYEELSLEDSSQLQFNITNSGNIPLEWDSEIIALRGGPRTQSRQLSISLDPAFGIIEPASYMTCLLSFSPADTTGTYNYELQITSNDPVNPVLTVPVEYLVTIPPAYIPDDNFRMAINQVLEQPSDYQPTITDLESLSGTLYATNDEIVSLEGAQHLINVQVLHFEENQISDLSPLSGLTNLQELSLGYNQISDLSPLISLINLQTLYLYENQINDLSSLSSLNNLQNLHLGHNQISDLSSLGSLDNLQNLALDDNQISDLSSLSSLDNLQNLHLNDNQISDLSPLSALINLWDLWLWNNQISDISPLSSLNNLNNLLLFNNPLSYESMLLSQSWSLPYTTSEFNALAPCYPDPQRNAEGVEPNTGLSWQANYDTQTAQYEVYLGSEPQSLEYMGIGYLDDDTSYDFETMLEPFTQYYWRIKAIAAADTIWSGMWSFTTGDMIPEIIVPDDNFRMVINEVLEQTEEYQPTILDLESLTGTLWADNKGIVSLEGAQYLSNMQRLYLRDNQISDLNPLSSLNNLLWLLLGNNQISDLSPLSSLTNLQDLDLHDNQISELDSLSSLVNVTELDLQDNLISNLSPLSSLTNVQDLDLQDNQISDLSPLNALINLTELDLRENQISELGSLSTLTNLEKLYMNDNQISNLGPLSSLTTLQRLYVNNNQIIDLTPLSSLSNLLYLEFSNNQINELSALSTVSNLRKLYLNGNQISDISALAGLGSLTGLYLDDNPLSQESMLLTQSWALPYTTSSFNALAPCYPEPNRDAVEVDPSAGLSWQANYDYAQAEYQVYLGSDPESLIYQGYGYLGQDTSYAFDAMLEPFTEYYWRIKAIAAADTIWSGLWSFTTGEEIIPDEPQIAVNPEYIDYDIPQGESAQLELELSNAGNANLAWTATVQIIRGSSVASESVPQVTACIMPETYRSRMKEQDYRALREADIPESSSLRNRNLAISLNPDYGTVEPDSSLYCYLEIDSGSSLSGLYEYEIVFSSNAVNSPELIIPVSIQVTGALAYIPDDNFRMAINEALGQATDYQPTIADLESLTGYWDAHDRSIVSIEGAQHLINLQRLYLYNNQIIDITPLTGLSNLQGLYLYNNLISDISPLSSLSNLQTLNLRDNQISDLNPLSGLNNLQELLLESNQISDLSPLTNLSNLSQLDLDSNQISDLSPLSSLTALQELSLGLNQISDFSPLSGLTNLQDLWLPYSQISDLSPLSSLTALQNLYLRLNQISDLSPLSGLTNLQYLYLGLNQISDLSPLAGLTNLQDLVLSDNQISDLSSLSSLTTLQSLYVIDNQISDLAPLSSLSNLEYLELSNNPLSKESMLLSQSWALPFTTSSFNALAPCYPEPARNATGVEIYSGLFCQGDYDLQQAQFELYIGESPQSLSYMGNGFMLEPAYCGFETILEPSTQYFWRVKAIAYPDTIWSGLWSFTTGQPGSILTIGEGNSNLRIPINPYYVYSYSQSIFLQSEIDIADQRIETVWYYWNGAAEAISSNDWTVYMGHTANAEFASTSSWIPRAELYQVFQGDVALPATAGWIEIPLSTPFEYNNIDNLVIAVDENEASYDGSSMFFYGTDTATNRSIRYYSDVTNPDPSAPPPGTLVLGYPNLLLQITDDEPNPITLISPEDDATGLSIDGFDLTWAPDLSGEIPETYAIYMAQTIDGLETSPYIWDGITDTFFDPSQADLGQIIYQYSETWYWSVKAFYSGGGVSELTTPFSFTISEEPPDFAGGTGTEADPYLVSNIDHLSNVSFYLDAHFLQTSDIDAWTDDLSWMPIGDSNTAFTGVYDGDNHTITRLKTDNPYYDYQGLFGVIQNAEIRNLYLTEADVHGNNWTGSLVGLANDSSINNCGTSSGSVSGEGGSVGGLVGRMNNSTITHCHSNVEVSGLGFSVGGLVGRIDNTQMLNCSSQGQTTGNGVLGGLVGYIMDLSELTACFSSGIVAATGDYAGGITGSCVNASIQSCYSLASVSGNSYVAGLVGEIDGAEISDCFSTGTVTGTSNTGGLIGYETRSSFVLYCYWDTISSGLATSVLGSGRTTTEMTYPYAMNTYNAWDFADVWAADIDYEINNGYPYLLWQAPAPEFYPPQNLTAAEILPDLVLTWQDPLAGTPESYHVWRLQPGQESDEASWTSVNAAVNDTTATDPQWNYLADGSYKWAVKAMYAGGGLSSATFSNELEKAASVALISVSPASVLISMIAGDTYNTDLTLENSGTAPLVWTAAMNVIRSHTKSLSLSGSGPSREDAIYFNPGSGTINPGDSQIIDLSCYSDLSYEWQQWLFELIISSNAVNNPTVTVPITVDIEPATPPNTAPVVSNVHAAQRDEDSMLIDIYYDVYDADGDALTISMEVSADDGLSWDLSCLQLLPDSEIGAGILSGTDKHIVWDAAAEHPNLLYGSNFRFRISADDGSTPPLPENFVLVEGGTFNNGTSDVTVSSFYMDKYELTQAGYQAVMGTNPASGYGVGSNYPVYYVSWFNAIEYSNRRSMQEGLTPCYSYSSNGTNPDSWPNGWNSDYNNHTNVNCNWTANGYRLPTEAEWHFAARGGNQTHNYTYSGSNTIGDVAWYDGNNNPSGTKPVGGKLPNELGLYDMSGNVWEWCWDIYGNYPSGPQNNPTGSNSGSGRVRRGGSWFNFAVSCAVSYRGGDNATVSNSFIGFRVCRVSP